MVASNRAYPRWVRLRKNNGNEKAIFEVIEIKAVTELPSMLDAGATIDR